MTERKRKPGSRKPKRRATPPEPGAGGNPWPARLKKLRVAIGEREGLGRELTQTEAGNWIGVSQNLWSAWERGTRSPDASRQILIGLLETGKLPKPKK